MNGAILGIDPGVSGGLAVLAADGTPVHHEGFQPGMTETALVAAVSLGLNKLTTFGFTRVYIENVQYIGARPDQGKKGDGGQGAFTFGRVVGLLHGAVLMWQRERGRGSLHLVTPMMWQMKLECLTGGVKNISKAKALELFPSIKMTHAIADAYLIAEHGRREMLRNINP